MIESNRTKTNHFPVGEHDKGPSQEPAEKGSMSPAGNSTEVDELNKRIEELQSQLKEKEDKYLYLYADFDNFKKRSIKERSDLIKFSWEPLARELLQTVDNIERALTHVPPETDQTLIEGLQMVLHQFKASLQKQGVQPIESLKKEFDPNLHEAVGQEPSNSPSGTITQEHLRGYTLHGRLLRAAKVSVSSGPTKTE